MGLFGGGSKAPSPIIYSGLNLSSSELDIPVPIFWGQVRLGTNAIDYNDFTKHPVNPKGKGLGLKGPQQFDYTASLILGLSRGVIDSIKRIFPQGSTTSTTTLAKLNMTFFSGTTTQLPWSFMTTNHPTKARAYARTAYVATSKMDLGMSATIPDNQLECVRKNGFAYTTTSNGWINPTTHVQDTDSVDCLMSDIVPDMLTNVDYGLDFAAGEIGSTAQYAAYQRAQGLSFSPLLNRQEKATAIVDRFAQISNAWIYSSGTQIQFVPLGDSAITANGVTYTPDVDVAYDLGVNDFIADKGQPLITVDQKDPADLYNVTIVQITDRTMGYITNPFEYKNQTLINRYGRRDSASVQASEIKNPAVGNIVKQLIGKRNAYIDRQYSFKLSHRYIRLLPGSIVTLTEPNIGLAKFPVRVREIDEDDDDTLNVIAENFPGVIGSYTADQQKGFSSVASTIPDQFAAAPSVNTPAVIEPSSAFTGGIAEIIVAASGPAGWGGCVVNISFDASNYTPIGTISNEAPQGLLTANLASHADPDTTDTLSVDLTESLTTPLTSITHADADALRTLALICAPPTVVGPNTVLASNGELISFGTVAATGTYTANLTYLRRGQYGTAPASHSTNDLFSVIDVLGSSRTSVAFALPKQYIGQPIYLKLQSFNQFGPGTSTQDLSLCTQYKYTPTGVGFGSGANGVPATPTGLTAAAGGSGQVVLNWNANPATDNVTSYQVYRAAGSGAAFGSALLVATVNALTFTNSGLSVGGAYTYFLIAANAAGSSANTAGVNATAGTSGTSSSAVLPVQAIGTTNVNIASPGTTLDGYTLATGDRILLTGQTTGSQNGIWTFNGSASALTRPSDYAAASVQRKGLLVSTGSGTTYPAAIWLLGTDNVTVDTTTSTWTQFSSGGGSGALTLITKVVTSGSQSSVTFSSIASTFTHLVLSIMGRGSQAATTIDIRLQFNSDTGSNYNSEVFVQGGTGAGSAAEALAAASIRIGDITAASATANYAGLIEAVIQGYAQTTFFKPVAGLTSGPKNTSGGGQNVEIASGLWLSTVAINAIKVFPSAGNFVDGSIVALYGRS